MTDVLVSLDIGNEHLALAHSVLAILRHIHRCLDGATQLQLVGFNWDYADEWHLDHELLGVLEVEAVLLDGPAGSFQEESLDVGT